MKTHVQTLMILGSLALATSVSSARADDTPAASPTPAQAQKDVSTQDVEEAKTFFGVGTRAYERGDFVSAIAAFSEAQKRAPKAAVVFAIAQAQRRQYYIDKKPEHLLGATRAYRQYVRDAPQGNHAADAAQYLSELGLAEERAAGSPSAAPSELGAGQQQPTRLSVNASSAVNALVSLDGSPPVEAPLIQIVRPGKHSVVISARGYIDETREVVAVDGSFVAVDVALRERPARLEVMGHPGARIEIDGRLVAAVPHATPIAVVPGTHLVAVSTPGHDPYVRELDFSRDESKRLNIKLGSSTRRRAANIVAVGSGVVALGSLAFVGLALERESAAKDLLDKRQKTSLMPSEREDYEDARSARDRWSTAAILTGGVAVGLGGTALILYLFDDRPRNIPTIQSDQKPQPKHHPDSKDVPVFGFMPVFAPGHLGGAVGGRF